MNHKYTSRIHWGQDLLVQPVVSKKVRAGERFRVSVDFPHKWEGHDDWGGAVWLDQLQMDPRLAERLTFLSFEIGCKSSLLGPIPMSIVQKAQLFTFAPIPPRQEVSVCLESTFDDEMFFRAEWTYARKVG